MGRMLLTNFTSGELSPLMRGRVDLDQYFNGCDVLRNMVVMPHGGATRRPGTYFAAETKTSASASRLIPFIFSTEQAYMLEFGSAYIRFYKDKGQIVSGGSAYEISAPYSAADAAELHYAQTADTMYITHPDHPVYKLTRTGHTSWTLTAVDFQGGPFGSQAAATITPGATTGSITLTAGSSIFASTDVGRLISILMDDSKWYSCKITAYTSGTVVTATVQVTLPNTNAASAYRMGVWCSALGYPRTVTFFEQRLCFGGMDLYPQTAWASQSGDYENFLTGANDSDAVEYTIADDEVNAILWMIPRDSLIIGTTGGEARLGSTSNLEALTPTNVSCRMPTSYGSADVRPLRIGTSTLFVQRGGRTVRDIMYDLNEDSYSAKNLSILSEHITKAGIVDAAYQQEPFSIAWFVLADGTMVGLTYLKEHNVMAWHRHDTDGVIESIAVIPGSTYEDELWMIVKRTINGATKRFVEYMMPFDFDGDNHQEDAFFVDCGLTYDGAAATIITGLTHLEGETVQVLADGANHTPRTVSSGSITLTESSSVVHAGLGYISPLKTINLEIASQSTGTSQGKQKRVNECTVRFHQTLGCKMGRDEDHLDTIPFRTTTNPLGSPPPLFTGDKKLSVFKGDWDTSAYIYLVQDMPLPMTVLCIVPVLDMA